MANFRAERLFIRVNGALDFDPNEGINAEEFAYAMVCDADAYDRPSLQDYSFAPFERPRWFPASKGLTVVRAVIAEEEARLHLATPEEKTEMDRKLEVLRAVEDKLNAIDLKDYKFYFLVRDLD
jgi:hypothetical protein